MYFDTSLVRQIDKIQVFVWLIVRDAMQTLL